MRDDFTGVILAGGRGSRLRMDKSELELGGRLLIERLMEQLRSLFPSLLLVVDADDSPLGRYEGEDVRVAADLLPGQGPLGGIYTALEQALTPFIFVVACDMPFPCLDLIRLMVDRSESYQAVVPRRGDLIEPLFAVYSHDALAPLRRHLEQQQRKIYRFLDSIRVLYIEAPEIDRCDPARRCFLNINTPEDLERARHLLSE
ncbi:MAG: molybdenum cofactor guanylyltransferase [Candidatus Geothermincolia bacterium]